MGLRRARARRADDAADRRAAHLRAEEVREEALRRGRPAAARVVHEAVERVVREQLVEPAVRLVVHQRERHTLVLRALDSGGVDQRVEPADPDLIGGAGRPRVVCVPVARNAPNLPFLSPGVDPGRRTPPPQVPRECDTRARAARGRRRMGGRTCSVHTRCIPRSPNWERSCRPGRHCIPGRPWSKSTQVRTRRTRPRSCSHRSQTRAHSRRAEG